MTETPIDMSDLDAARTVVHALEERRAAIVARRIAAGDDREAVAFAALAEGNAAAAEQLRVINERQARAELDLASVDAALVTASRRVAAAEGAEALVAERERMRGVATITEALRGHAARLDALLAELVGEYGALMDGFGKLQAAGFDKPSLSLIAVNAPRCVQSALVGTPLESERIPPSARRTFVELVEGWAAGADARAAAVLGSDS